jgi:hypothetical protein
MVLHRDTMNPPNTALGNAFAQMMKNKQIKTVPMNTDLVNPVSPETIMSKAQEYKNSFTELPTKEQIEAVMSEDFANSRETAIALASSQDPLSNAERHELVAQIKTIDELKMYEGTATTVRVTDGPEAGAYTLTEQAPAANDDGAIIIDKEDKKALAKAQAALDKLTIKDRSGIISRDETDDTQPEQDEYPDPEAVLHSVESRTTGPRHKKPMQKPPAYKENKPVQKKAPALFALSENRPASALLKNIFDPSTIDGVDGVDHINIHNDAITKLGRLLDMNAKTPFVHPELGMFHCVGGMWHYIKTRPMIEELRVLHGAQLRHKVSQMKKDAMEDPYAPQSVGVPGFKTIMADAMWHKVTQSPEIVTLMTESTLPFEHYFTQGALNLRQYPSEGFWTVAAFEEIRRVIKHRMETGDNEAQPDFSKLEDMRNPRAGIDKPYARPQPRNPSPYGKPRQGEGYFNRAR